MPLGNRSSIIANQDVAAATFVVGNDLAIADFQRLEDALLNVPSGGASIAILADTLSVPAGGYLLPNFPVKISGAGTVGTTIDMASNTGSIFTLGQADFTLTDLTVIGDAAVSQTLISNVAPAGDEMCFLDRVRVGTTLLDALETIIDANSLGRLWRVSNCWLTAQGPDPYFMRDGGNGSLYIDNTNIRQNGAIGGTIICLVTNSEISGGTNGLAFAGSSKIAASAISGNTITFGNSCQVTGTLVASAIGSTGNESQFVGCTLNGLPAITTTGVLLKVIGNVMRSISCTGGGSHQIIGNDFFGGGNNVTFAGTTNCNVTGNNGIQVLESGAANGNVYADNKLFTGSTIIGADSIVEGSRKNAVSAGATVDAFTAVFTRTGFKGMIGIGTIKNTGANDLNIRETVTDAFGVTDSATTLVTAGNDYMLDIQTNFATARPPYTSYGVEVQSANPGNPTTYDLQFSTQGSVT